MRRNGAASQGVVRLGQRGPSGPIRFGGFKGGQVVGASTAKAEEVQDRPVYPADLLGSIYHLGGLDPNAKLPHPMGLDAFVLPSAAEGVKSAGLLTEIM